MSVQSKLDTIFDDTTELQRCIIDHCAEALMVVDKDGFLAYINSSFKELHKVDNSVLDKHVTEVIGGTRMHIVAQTGVAEYDQLQKINGKLYIVSRLPLYKNDEIIGAIGYIRFANIDAIQELSSKMENLDSIPNVTIEPLVDMHTRYTFENLSTNNPRNKKLKQLAMQVALTDTTVLLRGESGSGKEVFAHSIHAHSPRKNGPFVAINCSAIQESLFESELFGYESGAFTGAHKNGKKGKFELAENGTIFLDEIGEMPLSTQAKLLRVIQDKQVTPLGSEKARPINVRIIAATNQNLEKMVEKKSFREDLFYRLNVIPLTLIPLRETPEEIPTLSQNIWRHLALQHGILHKYLSQEAIAVLCKQAWKGNIRELKNILERVLVVAPQQCVTAKDIENTLGGNLIQEPAIQSISAYNSLNLNKHLDQTEKQAILHALITCDGNKAQTARMLGISRPHLYKKMNKFSIDLA